MPEANFYLPFVLLVWLTTVFQPSFSHRRITSGFDVTTENKFMVYFLKAPSSPTRYVGWTCGGAIISKDYILTSASCVEDVQHMYVVAGYNKYVTANKMDKDRCVRERKKKVVLTCVPRSYQLDYNKTEIWSREDIAVVKVESPFDFDDTTYELVCSYTPKPIEFNVERSFPKVGDDAIVLGWGHTSLYRKDKDLVDFNNAMLKFASVKIMDENECVKYYSGNEKIVELIRKSMLCTLEGGNLNDRGELIARTKAGLGCVNENINLKTKICDDNEFIPNEFYAEVIDYDDRNDARRQIENTDLPNGEQTTPVVEEEAIPNMTTEIPKTGEVIDPEGESKVATTETTGNNEELNDYEDRPGICQNDHGGPLVTWRGGKVIVVAVATMFKQDNQRQCRGPFLYTKTWCNGVFLHCILEQEKNNSFTRRCNDPREVGFEMIRRQISWVGHKDGPADNERIRIRHQVPISAYNP